MPPAEHVSSAPGGAPASSALTPKRTVADLDAEEAAAMMEADPKNRVMALALVAVTRNELGLGDPMPAFRKAQAAAKQVSDPAERERLLRLIEEEKVPWELRDFDDAKTHVETPVSPLLTAASEQVELLTSVLESPGSLTPGAPHQAARQLESLLRQTELLMNRMVHEALEKNGMGEVYSLLIDATTRLDALLSVTRGQERPTS